MVTDTLNMKNRLRCSFLNRRSFRLCALAFALFSGSASANNWKLDDAQGQSTVSWFMKDGPIVWIYWNTRLSNADAEGAWFKHEKWRFDCLNRRAQIDSYSHFAREIWESHELQGRYLSSKELYGSELKWQTFANGSTGSRIFSLVCP